METVRCTWARKTKEEAEYHDTEWGVPVHDDRKLFEFLVLDAFQAGLSWLTILRKRENFRKAFDDFDYQKIARYDEAKIQSLLQDEGIIRNRLKVYGTVTNAQQFIKVQEEFGSFDTFIWQFTDGKTLQNQRAGIKDIPPRTDASDAMSKALGKRGFKFVGSTICYAFMQAAGMVNDHEIGCFRHKEVLKLAGN
ncbi:MAG: DNA-3-methyladenine glycosylase I [Chitinophagales bacterium]|nr:DNA-3-methyladenine glycosylase I [Chitinophagales bacterium]